MYTGLWVQVYVNLPPTTINKRDLFVCKTDRPVSPPYLKQFPELLLQPLDLERTLSFTL